MGYLEGLQDDVESLTEELECAIRILYLFNRGLIKLAQKELRKNSLAYLEGIGGDTHPETGLTFPATQTPQTYSNRGAAVVVWIMWQGAVQVTRVDFAGYNWSPGAVDMWLEHEYERGKVCWIEYKELGPEHARPL